jgi:hypothetical protein
MMASDGKKAEDRGLPAIASSGEVGGHLGSYVTSQPEELSVVADPWNLKLKPAKLTT